MIRDTLIGISVFQRMRAWILGASVGVLILAVTPMFVQAASLTIDTTSLTTGAVGAAYAQALAASGDVAPYTWDVSSGVLPGGLMLTAATGVISGSPTAAGATVFTVRVTDSASHVVTKELSLTVNAAIGVGTASLADGVVGMTYAQTLVATGGVSPFTWAIAAGSVLPTGLTLNPATGAIGGMPAAAGATTFTVLVTDARAQVANRQLTIVTGWLVVSPATLPGGAVNAPYTQTLVATGGVAPYQWSITAGSLPAGLSLTSLTGMISGTPLHAQAPTFSVQAMDSRGHTAVRSLSIVIGGTVSGNLKVTKKVLPSGQVGVAYSQNLIAEDGIAPYSWTVITGGLPAGLTLNGASGAITGTPTVEGRVEFGVQVTDAASNAAIKSIRIKIDGASTSPASNFDTDVNAVCDADAPAKPSIATLCQIFADAGMPPWVHNVIGHVILMQSERAPDRGGDDDGRIDRKDKDNDHGHNDGSHNDNGNDKNRGRGHGHPGNDVRAAFGHGGGNGHRGND